MPYESWIGQGQSRSRRPVVTLPPWTRALRLGLSEPGAFIAVLVSTMILACATASAELFLSSASSAAIQQQATSRCPDAIWPGIGETSAIDSSPGIEQQDQEYPRALAAAGLPGAEPVLSTTDPVLLEGETRGQGAVLLYRPGIADKVTPIGPVSGTGIFLSRTTAEYLSSAPGKVVRMGGVEVTVAGVYEDLYREPVRPYWCSYTGLFMNFGSPPPPLVLVADSSTFYRIASNPQTGPDAPFLGLAASRYYQVPIDTASLTRDEAERLLAMQTKAIEIAGLGDVPPYISPLANEELPEVIERTSLIVEGLSGPVLPIAITGSLLALLLVGNAGSFWFERRRREVELLSSRGVGPSAMGFKASLELVVPAAGGTLLGFLLGIAIVNAFGPSDDLDSSAMRAALLAGVVGFVAGLLLLAVVAGLRCHKSSEASGRTRRSRPAEMPWELLLLGMAAYCYVQVGNEGAIVQVRGVAQVNLFAVSYPLLLLAGGVILSVRLIVLTLPTARRYAKGRKPVLYLALARLAASRVITAVVVAAVTLPIAVLTYSTTLTASAKHTLAAKAGVLIGSDRAVISVDRFDSSRAIDSLGALVIRYEESVINGEPANVLAVDPASFLRYAFWDSSFSDQSLGKLTQSLQQPLRNGRLPVVAMGVPAGPQELTLGDDDPLDVDVVGVARVLPGRRLAEPLVLVDAEQLGLVDRSAVRTSEVWSSAPEEAVTKAIIAEGARVFRVSDRETVYEVANFLGVGWTFEYMEALAVSVGFVAAGGLCLYLATRQRRGRLSYIMMRRMGMTLARHFASLLIEFGLVVVVACLLGVSLAAAAVATAYRGLDVDPLRAPSPLLDVPTQTLVLTGIAAGLVALISAAQAHHTARQTAPAEVMRLGS